MRRLPADDVVPRGGAEVTDPTDDPLLAFALKALRETDRALSRGYQSYRPSDLEADNLHKQEHERSTLEVLADRNRP